MDRKKALLILNINENNINYKILKDKYNEACLKHHPDKSNSKDFHLINEAYKYLKTEEKKTSPFFYFDEELIYSTYLIFKSFYEPLHSHILNYRSYNIKTTLDKVINKELYLLKEHDLYIPLWHQELLFESLNLKINIEIILPDYVDIDDNNNIIIYLDLNNKKKGDYITFKYSGLDLSFNYETNKKIFKCMGIPIINYYNIYDFSLLSDVILIIS